MEDKEYITKDDLEKFRKQLGDTLIEIESIQNNIELWGTQLTEVKNYIHNKIQKSMEYDMGINDNRSDHLFTETVIELQIIESMIDKILGEEEENDGR